MWGFPYVNQLQKNMEEKSGLKIVPKEAPLSFLVCPAGIIEMKNDETTVFVVDDDPSVTKGLRRLLRSAGHKVETFLSAQDFLEADSRSSGPACLILDVKMPGLNGFELQERLLQSGNAMSIVFIVYQ